MKKFFDIGLKVLAVVLFLSYEYVAFYFIGIAQFPDPNSYFKRIVWPISVIAAQFFLHPLRATVVSVLVFILIRSIVREYRFQKSYWASRRAHAGGLKLR